LLLCSVIIIHHSYMPALSPDGGAVAKVAKIV
jgi:hypothetical protein